MEKVLGNVTQATPHAFLSSENSDKILEAVQPKKDLSPIFYQD